VTTIEYSIRARALAPVLLFGQRYRLGEGVTINMAATDPNLVAALHAALSTLETLEEVRVVWRRIPDWQPLEPAPAATPAGHESMTP
jgi:hypothetical protein